MYMLETLDLTKKYTPPKGIRRALTRSPISREIVAVDSLNLKVRRGEIIGVLGPNGAGKTTLFKMLTTLLRPTAGRAMVGGFDIVREENEVKRIIGLTTGEERSFYWRLTGRQNLSFFAALAGIPRGDIPKKTDGALEWLGLASQADNMFYSYSSGMKQKLSIARALLAEPKVLFCDEPTKSVDAMTARDLRHFLKELSEKHHRTVLLATHRMEEAEELCDRVAIMDKGRIHFCGPVEELKSITGHREKYTLAVEGIPRSRLLEIKDRCGLASLSVNNANSNGVLEFSFISANGNASLSGFLGGLLNAGGTVLSCEKQQLRLEEMFVDLIKGGRD